MNKQESSQARVVLKFIKWLVLSLLIAIYLLAILNGTNMIRMQSKQISAGVEALNQGNIVEVEHLIGKDMILTHQLLSYAFSISNFCLLSITVFLTIMLRNTRKRQNKPGAHQ